MEDDPSSGGDEGILYAARNYLKTNHVTADPMRNINTAEHLHVVEQFTTGLILAAALHFWGLTQCQAMSCICQKMKRFLFNELSMMNPEEGESEAHEKFVHCFIHHYLFYLIDLCND